MGSAKPLAPLTDACDTRLAMARVRCVLRSSASLRSVAFVVRPIGPKAMGGEGGGRREWAGGRAHSVLRHPTRHASDQLGYDNSSRSRWTLRACNALWQMMLDNNAATTPVGQPFLQRSARMIRWQILPGRLSGYGLHPATRVTAWAMSA